MTKTEYNPARNIFERQIQEEDVLKEIMVRLQFAKIYIFRIRENLPTGYRMSDPGIPDLHGRVPRGYALCYVTGVPGPLHAVTAIPVYIEVKKPGEMDKYHRGALKPKRMRTIYLQSQFLESARADGCIAFFAESWADVVVGFKEQGGIILPE